MITRIMFDAQATIQQDVVITKEDLTPEQLVEGLNTGTYMTTIAYDNNYKQVNTICGFDDEDNEITVAEIKIQLIMNSDYTNFELKPTE